VGKDHVLIVTHGCGECVSAATPKSSAAVPAQWRALHYNWGVWPPGAEPFESQLFVPRASSLTAVNHDYHGWCDGSAQTGVTLQQANRR